MKVTFGLKVKNYFPILYKIFSTKSCSLFFEREMLTFTVRNISLETFKRV